jgi:hypothetical protein
MNDDQSRTKMWALDGELDDQKVRPTHDQRKIMIIVFCGGDGPAVLDILPQGWRLTSKHFHEHIIRALAMEKYPTKRKPGRLCYMVYFDNSHVHGTGKVEQIPSECEFQGLEHTLSSLVIGTRK